MFLQKKFDVDEAQKNITLKIAGRAHRTFRTALAHKWLRDKKGNINHKPPSLYASFIEQDVWSAFVRKRTEDEEFLVYTIIFITCIYDIKPCINIF